MYEIAICDDEPRCADDLQTLLGEVLDERGVAHHVSLYANPDELLHALEGGTRCDLILQDILFGDEQGVRFAKLIRERRWDIDVVFVTSTAAYAVESYEAYPLSYLLKPVTRGKLAEVLDRFLERRTPRILRLSTSRGVVRLPTADVLYFEIFDHDIRIHRVDGSTQSWTGTLKELEGALPPRCFVRPHRSYLVNLEHVSAISRAQITLSSGDAVPISKNLYRKVQTSLVEYDDHRS